MPHAMPLLLVMAIRSWHHADLPALAPGSLQCHTANWAAKLNLALVKEGVVSKQELQRSLPTPHQLATYGCKSPDTMGGDVPCAP